MSIPSLLAIIALVYTIAFARRVADNIPEGSVYTEPLLGLEKLNVWLVNIVNPIWSGFVLYFTWRKKLPTKAKQASHVSFIVFGIELVIGCILVFLLMAYGGPGMTPDYAVNCTVPESSRNSTVYNRDEAACYIAQRVDVTTDQALYVIDLMEQQLKELGLTEGSTPKEENPFVDPYRYVLERNKSSLTEKEITKIIDAEYYYEQYIGIIQK